MTRLLCIALAALIGALGWAQAPTPGPLTRPGVKPILLVPIYVYPHSWGVNEYRRLVSLQKRHPNLRVIVIFNVDFDFRDWKTDPEYRRLMTEIARDLDAAGIALIGYVSSSYSRRPFQGDPRGSGFASDFKTNVDRWVQHFPMIRGIFVDEMCYNLALYEGLEHPCAPLAESKAPLVRSGARTYKDVLPYYRELYRYIRQTRGLEAVITNPGQQVNIAFYDGTVADAIIVYEGSEAYFDPTVYPLGSKPDMTGLLLYNDPAPFALAKLRAVVGRVGLFFATDTMLINNVLNPWGALPKYLEELADYLDSPQP